MNNRYILLYTLIMSLITAVVLAFVVNILHPRHIANEEVYNKKDILSAIKDQLGQDPSKLKDKEILALFDTKVEQITLDATGKTVEDVKAEDIDVAAEDKKPLADRKYPLFVYKGEKGNIYLMTVRGNGLWDKIWGYIALADDFNTIVGTSFGHAAETPGLGAEIKDNPNFSRQFQGKTIFEGPKYVSVGVVKGGVKRKAHEVDGISGATITSRGVHDMLYKGIAPYLPYFESLKTK
ncbi:MAG TPA: NADH:ubiquinone reductase (Na(+)-transporting) subunit C [Saprospiraceae bacterium]|nr:NADH:ubiquinone reductase (Na(+)-transporting) subunit C [Saprospiraceae bacterium]